MQDSKVGLVCGPAMAGALMSTLGWPMLSFLIAALAVAASILALGLRDRPADTLAVDMNAPFRSRAIMSRQSLLEDPNAQGKEGARHRFQSRRSRGRGYR